MKHLKEFRYLDVMGRKKKHSIIETISEKLKLIPSLHEEKEIEINQLAPKDRFTPKIMILWNFRCFRNRLFGEKSISQDRIWIEGRPQSRWDPPRPRKKTKSH